ncbi:FRG domain-containing protein (plasmid) [Pantoea agglomerans]|uniref:FRG domain-containing protein n=1 Tax=Enterobacter agglomerans TaxID=549 RepID=UPI0010C1CB7F|nr:FRG domain-containing protein [Pantoea agglomerans]TKJ58378.1 hypothetical protein PagCFBP13505_07560 [Pantoea agglomerans]TKK37822.1 hypothetical protein PagCFBP13532_02925 [Pantoea agglomerans]
MLNLIMSSNDQPWQILEGHSATASMDLSRYLEYTNDDIYKDFIKLTNEVIEKLKSLPCLLMTEFDKNYNNKLEIKFYSNVRLVRLTSIAVKDQRINYTFELLKDYGMVDVTDFEDIPGDFINHRFETSRTHWALKNIELNTVLTVFGLTPIFVSPPSGVIADNANDIPRSDIYVDSVVSYLEEVNKFKPVDGTELFYRGHSDIIYKLEPSLFRSEKGVPLYVNNEKNMINEMVTAHPSEFYHDDFMADKLVRMQHYRLPTRLLDVTANPLVALYFCCSEKMGTETEDETIGDVKIFTVNSNDVKFYNSDTVSCIANISQLNAEEKEYLINEPAPLNSKKEKARKRLLHFIRAEKPYFEDAMKIEHLRSILFFRGRVANSRISSQSGAFLLFGHDAVLPDTGYSNLNVKSISVCNKKEILKQLELLNIKASTIYPGIEETAKEIAKKFKSDVSVIK